MLRPAFHLLERTFGNLPALAEPKLPILYCSTRIDGNLLRQLLAHNALALVVRNFLPPDECSALANDLRADTSRQNNWSTSQIGTQRDPRGLESIFSIIISAILGLSMVSVALINCTA